MVVIVAGLSLLLALNPNSMILEIVSYAWAGFGAAFGPLIIISLFWRKMTLNGALAGVIAGGITVLLWKNFMGFTGLYEIVPGFIFSAIAIYVGSLMSVSPNKEVTSKFDEAKFLYTAEGNK